MHCSTVTIAALLIHSRGRLALKWLLVGGHSIWMAHCSLGPLASLQPSTAHVGQLLQTLSALDCRSVCDVRVSELQDGSVEEVLCDAHSSHRPHPAGCCRVPSKPQTRSAQSTSQHPAEHHVAFRYHPGKHPRSHLSFSKLDKHEGCHNASTQPECLCGP